MQESIEVADAMLNFYDRLSANDVASFERIVSTHPATVVVGTAPGERVTERDRLRFGFETEGVSMETGGAIGYQEGSMGWVLDEPTMYLPDGSGIKTRLTGVFHREGEAWMLVHMHVSVGVPDDEVVDLQKRWLS